MKWFNKFEIWQILIISISLLILISAITVYNLVLDFGYSLSENKIIDLHDNVQSEVFHMLEDYLAEAEDINKFNSNLAKKGIIDLDDPLSLGHYFLELTNSNHGIDFAFYANAEGGIVSSGNTNGESRLSFTNKMKYGAFNIHRVKADNSLELIKEITDVDFRTKSWYKEIDKNEEIFWTDVYEGTQDPVLGISTSFGLFDDSGNKIGVFGADILLDQITSYFKTLNISKNSRLYLYEDSGNIIVDTYSNTPFLITDGIQIRRNHLNSEDIFFNTIFQNKKEHDWFEKRVIDGKTIYLGSTNYPFNEFNSWNIGLMIPEDDHIVKLLILIKQFKNTFLLTFTILLMLLSVIVILIYKPLKNIEKEISTLSQMTFGNQIVTKRGDIIGKLIQSFNKMSKTIESMMTTINLKNTELKTINEDLESLVRVRTEQLRVISITDELTNLINRRELMRVFDREISFMKRNDSYLSIALIDIDFFKKVNDTHGHNVGDEVLQSVAISLESSLRDIDFVGRYGGEEFLIIMPQTGIDGAIIVAERCRLGIENLMIGPNRINVTISIGISEVTDLDSKSAIQKADSNLYKAKNDGRNCLAY